jgi:hypothetical protein
MIALLLLLAATTPAEPVAGTVCVTSVDRSGSPMCVETKGDAASLAAAAAARTFVWRRAKSAEIALGVVAAGATEIAWPERSIGLRIRDSGRTDAEPVTLDIAAAATQWQFRLAAREAQALRRLHVLDSDFTIAAAAPHRQPVQSRVTRERSAYELVLVPVPVWSGRVIDKRTRKGVAGALVTALPQETSLGNTDYNGTFSFEVPPEEPKALRFTSGGYGTKVIAAPAARTDAALPWIELLPAGTIVVEVEHEADLDVEVWQSTDERNALQVAAKRLTAEEKAARFEGIDAGDYELRLRGEGPFERYSIAVSVKEAEITTERIALDPVPLDISIVHDERPMPFARLHLTHMDPQWQTAAVADAAGHAKGTLWQRGLFVASVARPGSGGAHFTRRSLTGVHEIEWRIELSGGTVKGVVVDAVERFPVARAVVVLGTTATDRTHSEQQATTGEAGEFEFAFVPEGEQKLSVQATGYVAQQESFATTTAAPGRQFRIELVPAETIAVRVVSSYGAPLVGATITDALGATPQQWMTNAEGLVDVPFRRGETKTLFVVPREGSLAVAKITAAADGPKEQQIIVPKGEATIDIRTQDPAGKAIEGVEMLMRYNGVLLPDVVVRLMLRVQGNVLQTGAGGGTQLRNLPLGYYEFWPFFSRAEYQRLQSGTLPPGTALGVTPGNNAVVMTFEPAKR